MVQGQFSQVLGKTELDLNFALFPKISEFKGNMFF